MRPRMGPNPPFEQFVMAFFVKPRVAYGDDFVDEKTIKLIPLAGERRVYGFNAKVEGSLD